jgi:superfamily I DNA and RNA helicase
MEVIRNSQAIPSLFDAVLIDEAQDLPREFFQIVYLATHNPKRVIWAYDELQNLGSYAMAPPSELFGKDPSTGQAYVQLRNEPDAPHQDIVLPVCYRNTPWALTIAHALGFGIYREKGLVQLFDDLNLWNDIGYEAIRGRLAFDHQVALRRTERSTPSFFADRLSPDDAFKTVSFGSHPEQCAWTAEQISNDLMNDELEYDDVLVIFCDPISAATRASQLKLELQKKGIASHTVGVDRLPDEFFLERSIAISGIFRAKGNEASMVYILDSDRCFTGPELIKKRNILFTAITRSRAWVRMTGCGPAMRSLVKEVDNVFENKFVLDFKIPSELELASLRRIHRDMTEEERRKQQKTLKDLKEALAEIEQGTVNLADLDPQTRQRLKALLSESGE